MDGAEGSVEKRKRSFPAVPFYLAALLVTSSSGAHNRHGDVLQIFSGGEDALQSMSSPVTNAGDLTGEALDDDGFYDSRDRARALPVWPPPVHAAPVDPAKDPLVGAPPQHIDWPAGLPSAQRTSPQRKH
ncbi:MAG: hypothetical protein ABI183_11625 [Polyangiaceae bacterium]